MNIYVIDGQGGGIGRSLIARLKDSMPGLHVTAVGSNALATSSMMKSGADTGATGENAVVYCCAQAQADDIIAGPVGIIIANAMMGEFSPSMALAVSQSRAHKVLIPVSRCNVTMAGLAEKSLAQYIEDAIGAIRAMQGQGL